MAIQLGSAYGKVTIDASGVKAGVNAAKADMQSLAQMGAQLGESMQAAGQKLTVGLTLPILAMGAASIKAASDLSETRNKVKVVFGEMGDDMLEWGNTAATAFGMSKQEALEAAGTFGNLFTTMGLGKSQAADMSKGLVQLAADLASFNNMDPNEVLMKLRSGLVGETEPLRTLGINLTAAAVKAKAMEMGLASANGEVSQAAMVQARYALILEQTSNAQGDFARTSDGLANQSRILKAQFQDSLAMLGENLLPMALQVVQGLNKMLEAFNKMPPEVQKGFLALMGFLAVLGPLLSFAGTVLQVLSALSGLGISLSSISAIITGTVIPALAAVIAPILAVAWPILLIIATLGLLYWAFKTNFMGITTTVQQLWFIIKYYFSQGWTWLVQTVTGMLNSVVAKFKSINWRQLGQNIIKGIVDGFKSGVNWLVQAAMNAAKAALDAIKRTLGIASPSKKMMEMGKFSGQGYVLGLQKSMDPNEIARMVTRSVVNNNRGGDQTTINLAAGMTVRSARRLLGDNRRELLNELAAALG